MGTRGIVGAAGYLPHRRLDRSTMAAVSGGGGGKGTRTVAGYDEDTTTMGVEAARAALRGLPDVRPRTLWFSTVAPAYLDKTNATAIHAALRLDPDDGGLRRQRLGALRGRRALRRGARIGPAARRERGSPRRAARRPGRSGLR